MPRRKKRETWARYFAKRVGPIMAGKVIAFIALWAATEKELGRTPRVDEYAENWGISLATAYRDLARFKEAQPFFETPSGFIAVVGPDLSVGGRVPDNLTPREG